MRLFQLPDKSVRLSFILIVAFMAVLLAAPYIYAYINTPAGHYCTGVLNYPRTEVCDQNFYISWGPAQTANGHFLLQDKLNGYTNQRLVFNLWWLITGKISGWLHADTYLFNHIQRFFASLILCLVVFNLLSQFITEKRYLLMGFLLVLFSGYNLGPYPEGNIFESMLWEVILPAAHIFFFITLYYCYTAAFKNPKAMWKAGLASFIMGTVYPYATVSVCFIMFNVYLFFIVSGRRSFRQAAKEYLVLLFMTLPIVAYDYFIVSTDKRYVDGIATFSSPAIYLFVPAYGLLLLLALAGLYYTWKKQSSIHYFCAIWLISTFIQIYFPTKIIPFQIQLLMGVQVPMCVLALYGLKNITEFFWHKRQTGAVLAAFAVVFISAVASNATMYASVVQLAQKQIMPTYLEDDVVAGMHWLKQRAKEDDVIIAAPIISSYIPVLGLTCVYSSDYWAPTPDFPEKVKKINWLFSDTSAKNNMQISNFMVQNRISYIFQNNYKERRNEPLDNNSLSDFGALQLQFENPHVRIYALKKTTARI